MEECPICGKMSVRVSREKHEYFGRPVFEDIRECLNPDCGEEPEVEVDEEEVESPDALRGSEQASPPEGEGR